MASGKRGKPGKSEPTGGQSPAGESDGADRSLRDDVEILIEDGKTYLEAELQFQKTRALFVAEQGKSALVQAAIAAAFGLLALVGLTVGLIIALSPILTPIGASALVVGLLLGAAAVFASAARKRWNSLLSAIAGEAAE